MIPLKRLLNNENCVDGNDDDPAPAHKRPWHFPQDILEHNDTQTDDLPYLLTQSWTDVVGNPLYADNANTQTYNNEFEACQGEIDQTTPFLDDIEEWAAYLSHDFATHAVSDDAAGDVLCYGMIYRAACKLVGDMSDADTRLKAHHHRREEFFTFGLLKDEDQIFLTFPDATKFGHLNTQLVEALLPFMGNKSVQFDAVGHTETIREQLGRATKAVNAVARVSINIYGPEEQAKRLGQWLSSKKVYLQRPDQQRPGSTYANPHFLKLSESCPEQVDYRAVQSQSTVLNTGADDGVKFKNTIENVYSSLKRGFGLKRMEADYRLKTQLLLHQQEALEFMIQREQGPIPPDFLLWKPTNFEGQTWYAHAVTGYRSRVQHSETGGGILADEMGMGKSLCILSLITKTLNDAHSWASEDRAGSSTDQPEGGKHPYRATLIVVSSALLINNWLNEVKIHLDGSLRTVKYHGHRRATQVPDSKDADIVLTTYHTLAADASSKRNPFKDVYWYRVVLDEAHIIRRQSTTLYQTVSDLNAHTRWCLTGTPIQNKLEDIGALFAFIRARPFHSMAMFRRFIAVPFDESEESRALAARRLGLLIDSVCIRRRADLLHLPKQLERTRTIELSKEEREQYEQTKKIMIRAIRQQVSVVDRKNMFGIFQAQLQLRILCNHGTFQHSFSWARRSLLNEREDALAAVGQNREINCSLCRQAMPILGSSKLKAYAESCSHVLCSECLTEHAQENHQSVGNALPRCPLCVPLGLPATTVQADDRYSGQQSEDDHYFREQGHSSKMTALVADVRESLLDNKSIIFSSWTRTLNLIANFLNQESIRFERIDGECPLPRRQQILDDFAKDPELPVLIMTTGTGAYGLNLTSANRVFIVEPQWNPSVEYQAIARAMRLGQDRSVLVTRYVTKRTVEQEMRSQQDRKLRLAGVGWDS